MELNTERRLDDNNRSRTPNRFGWSLLGVKDIVDIQTFIFRALQGVLSRLNAHSEFKKRTD